MFKKVRVERVFEEYGLLFLRHKVKKDVNIYM